MGELTGRSTREPHLKDETEAAALQAVIVALQQFDTPDRARILAAAAKFFGVGAGRRR